MPRAEGQRVDSKQGFARQAGLTHGRRIPDAVLDRLPVHRVDCRRLAHVLSPDARLGEGTLLRREPLADFGTVGEDEPRDDGNTAGDDALDLPK